MKAFMPAYSNGGDSPGKPEERVPSGQHKSHERTEGLHLFSILTW